MALSVILDPDGYDLWLDPGTRDVAAASDLLKPYDARLMRRYPVSARINHVANDDEECTAPWNSPRFRIVFLPKRGLLLLDNLARTKYEKTGSILFSFSDATR